MSWQKRPAGDPLESGETEANSTPRFARKSATHKMMDLLARGALSELELRQKLTQFYSEDEINEAIAKAVESKWLTPPEEMAEKVAEKLGRKQKGHRFINQVLKQKGLPPIAEDTEAETKKACALLSTRLKHDFEDGPLPRELYEKAQRLLFNRGYSGDVIRRALSR